MNLLHAEIIEPPLDDGLSEPDRDGHRWRKLKSLSTGDALIHIWGICPREVAAKLYNIVQAEIENERTRADSVERVQLFESALGKTVTPPL